MSSPLVIFLAEDNAGDVLLVRQALLEERLDFELIVAEDGDKATRILGQIGNDLPRPHVVLLDLNLPRIEGPELFRRVREHPLCAETPIIVVTSSDSPKDHSWTQEFGISHYFRKPSDLDEFLKLGEIVREVAGSESETQ